MLSGRLAWMIVLVNGSPHEENLMYRASLQTASDSDALCCPSEYTMFCSEDDIERTVYIRQYLLLQKVRYTFRAVARTEPRYRSPNSLCASKRLRQPLIAQINMPC